MECLLSLDAGLIQSRPVFSAKKVKHFKQISGSFIEKIARLTTVAKDRNFLTRIWNFYIVGIR